MSLSQTIVYILMKKCYRLFYQYDILRLSACPFSIHALLHIADGIESAGPVWCYWAFAMERFCGAVGRHVKNRRDPYASLDRRVRELAQLQITKLKYGLMDELSPKGPVIDIRGGGMKFKDGPCRHILKISHRKSTDACIEDSDFILLPPKKKLEIDVQLQKKLAAALVTRFSPDDPQMKISMATASRHIPSDIFQWGQAQICGGGDRFKCRVLLKSQRYTRDCTYVKVGIPLNLFFTTSTLLIIGLKYEAEVDIYERQVNRAPVMVKKTFFGELQRIVCLEIPVRVGQPLDLLIFRG